MSLPFSRIAAPLGIPESDKKIRCYSLPVGVWNRYNGRIFWLIVFAKLCSLAS
jgi:hypothetical protein